MELKQTRTGDVHVLSVAGDLDAVTSAELEGRVLDVLDSGGLRVVLDLTQLDYVSSAGIRVFLMAYKRLKELGGAVHFCGLSPEVRRVFDVTGFSFRVPLYAKLDEAVNGFTRPT